jgi:transposase
LYVNRTGCGWRMLPHDFAVSWSAAHKHFLRWARDATWDRALAELRRQVRHAHGRNPEPSAGVIDSCSIKASPVRGPRGFDGAKKIDGIKRHVVVDTLGLLVAALVTAASVQDRAAVPRLLARARYRCPRLGHLWADQGYTGSVVQAVSRILRFTIQIVRGIKPKGGFITQPRRWVVEWVCHEAP